MPYYPNASDVDFIEVGDILDCVGKINNRNVKVIGIHENKLWLKWTDGEDGFRTWVPKNVLRGHDVNDEE